MELSIHETTEEQWEALSCAYPPSKYLTTHDGRTFGTITFCLGDTKFVVFEPRSLHVQQPGFGAE